MRPFIPALRRISSDLPLPEATRARILLELASDLEALVAHYRRRGLAEEEAIRRAEEKLLLSPEALEHLIAVHTTAYERWVSHAAGRLRWGFDLALFVIGVLPILIAGVFVAGARVPSLPATPLLWPILACGCAIVGISAVKAYQLFVEGERSTVRLHLGLPWLVFLGAAGPVLGLLAALFGLQELTTALLERPREASIQLEIVEQAGRDATVVVLGLLLAFAAGIVWFLLVNRIAAIERAESAAIFALD